MTIFGINLISASIPQVVIADVRPFYLTYINDTYNGNFSYIEGNTGYINITAFDKRYVSLENTVFNNAVITGNLTVNGNISGDYLSINQMSITTLNVTGNASVGHKLTAKSINITNNLYVEGNVSMKRPYGTFFNNVTQTFKNTANVQIVNLTQTADAYLIRINQDNITFSLSGDYLMEISVVVSTTTGTNKHIEIWVQKNGVNLDWSNTRVEVPTSGVESVVAVPFIIDIDNPATDNIRLMWWADTTAAQLLATAPATGPTRPGVPDIIVTVSKISEITP